MHWRRSGLRKGKKKKILARILALSASPVHHLFSNQSTIDLFFDCKCHLCVSIPSYKSELQEKIGDAMILYDEGGG